MLNISLTFIKHLILILKSYFAVAKNFRPNLTHNFIKKISNKQELQQTVFNHSSDIDFQDFLNLHKTCTANLMLLLHQIILHLS